MPGLSVVKIRENEWQCFVANQPWELAQGLGGCLELAPGAGMLFDCGWEQTIYVTTVPMLFALDIAFLSEELTVTEVYQGVWPGYVVASQSPARYFIEVNAGEMSSIAPGDQAMIEVLSEEGFPLADFDHRVNILPLLATMMTNMLMILLVGGLAIGIVKKAFAPREEEVKLYGPRGERLLPQTSASKDGAYIIERDRMGNIIITCTSHPVESVFLQMEADKELVYDILSEEEREDLDNGWRVTVNVDEPRSSVLSEIWDSCAEINLSSQSEEVVRLPGVAVMPHLPEESRKDPLFFEFIRDMVRLGEEISDEEAKQLWEGWQRQQGYTRQAAVIPRRKKGRPTRDDVTVRGWAERDRIAVWVVDNRTDEIVAEWWDEDAAQMFEDGFFKPADILRGCGLGGRKFTDSVLDYLEEIGVLEGGKGVSRLPQTIERGEVIEIPFRDAPQWVQDEWRALHGKSIPRVRVYRTTVARIAPPVFEYASRDIVAHSKGRTMRRYVPSYESLLASTPEEKSLYFGGAVPLGPDDAIAVMDYWGDRFKMIDLYVHPAAFEPPHLVAPKLTDQQLRILATIRAYTPRYRKEVFERQGVTDQELEELRAMGLLDRRNAITVMGRNVVGKMHPLQPSVQRKLAQDVIPVTPRESTEPIRDLLADSPEFVAQTLEATGYKDQLAAAFQEAIARANNPIPWEKRRALEEKYGEWAVQTAISVCPRSDLHCIEREARRLWQARTTRGE